MSSIDLWIPESLPCVLDAAARTRTLTRAALAEKTGLRPRRISEYLNGNLLPTRERLELLGRALDLSLTDIIRRTAWRPPVTGRPPHATETLLLRSLCPDTRYIPPRDRDFAFRMGAVRTRYPELLRVLTPILTARPDWPQVQRFLQDAPADSGDEGATYLHVLARGFTTHWISPLRLGFETLPVMDSLTGQPVGHRRRPVLALLENRKSFVLVPHVGVRPEGVPYTLDFLAGVSDGAHRAWGVLEVDGEGHNPARDRERRLRIGLPELRVTPEDLADPEFASRLLDFLLQTHLHESRARRTPCRCGTLRLAQLSEEARLRFKKAAG